MAFKKWSKTLQAASGSPDHLLLGGISRHVVRMLKQPRGDIHVAVTEASCQRLYLSSPGMGMELDLPGPGRPSNDCSPSDNLTERP